MGLGLLVSQNKEVEYINLDILIIYLLLSDISMTNRLILKVIERNNIC